VNETCSTCWILVVFAHVQVRTTSGGATFIGELSGAALEDMVEEEQSEGEVEKEGDGASGGQFARSAAGTTRGRPGSSVGAAFVPKMDHLACFLAGTLALGHAAGAAPAPSRAEDSKGGGEGVEGGGGSGGESGEVSDLALAVALAETCVRGYDTTATGLAPEIWWFHGVGEGPIRSGGDEGGGGGRGAYVKDADAFSLLRPETAESLFYLWRVTKDERWPPLSQATLISLSFLFFLAFLFLFLSQTCMSFDRQEEIETWKLTMLIVMTGGRCSFKRWREAGWRMFLAFERHAKVPSGGFASVEDVREAASEAASEAGDAQGAAPPPAGPPGLARALEDWRAKVGAAGGGAGRGVVGRRARQRDKMESFWLGETLKYLFLLFDDQVPSSH
jgi:hypothetical protein